MSNTISFDAYDEYLAKKKGATRVDTTRDYDLSTAGENILKGLIPGNTTSFVKGIEKATGKDLSGLRKAAAVMDFVPSKLDAGFLGAAEGITDFLAGGATQLVGQKEAAKWIYEHSWSRDLSGSDVVDAEIGNESKGYQLASDLISGVGNVGFQVAVGTLIGGALAAPVANGAISHAGARAISFAPLFASASGAGTAENIAKTGELGWRENVGGLLKGGVEVLTEVVSPTGKIVDRAINGKSAGSIFRYLSKHAVAKNIIVDFASEAGEEMASYAGGWFIENKLKISDEAFSARDMVYQGVLGGITGAIFAAPSDISLVRSARSSGAKVYAQGDAAVNNKINEGLIEVAALKERGLNNDNVKLAEAALAKLTTDENLSQTTKEYYLGLAEQMVLKQNLSDQYNALAKELVAKAKADPATAQSMADAFNALVNEAGGEGKYTAADFTNENSEAARIYVVAQMANDWLSRSDAEIATDEIMRRKAALYQGTAEQKNAIRSMGDGSTVAYRVGDNAYAVVTKRAGTDTYSVGFTTPGQVERDGAVYATHKLSADKVEELLSKPMTEQQIDAGIVENLAKKAQAEVEKEQKAEKKQAKTETKKKPAAKTTATETTEAEGKAKPEQTAKKTEAKNEGTQKKKAETENKGKKKTPAEAKKAGEKASLSPVATESAQTEQTGETETTEQTEKKAKPEDLSTVEKRLTSAFGIDGSEFTKEEWTKARECVPNIDGLTRREQARVLTLVRTAQANGINEDYMKGLARLSSVYGFGVVFEDIDVSGFYSRKHGMVVINPNNLDETYGHEIEHSFDQIIKEGKAEFRTDLSEKVKRIVGASVFDRAKAQYKADYDKLRARDGAIPELSDAELDAEASANVVGKYLSNMTILKKLAASDYSLGRGLLAAIRRMKDKWTSAKAFAKENDSTVFAEYRKMTRIERMLMQELAKRDARKAGDTAYSPATAESDSDGNTLSYGQQKYFARSKVRDANGRLLVVYHGTDADFDTFDLSRAGKNGRAEGFGFYFAANQEITRKYGDKQKKVYLNIEKPLYDNRRTVTKAELRRFANALVDYQVNENGENWRDTFISNYVDTYSTNRANAISQFVETVWEANENDQDLIYEIANGSGMNYDVDTMEPFYNVLYQSIGYDGNISTWEYVPLSGKKETNTIYVTFRPEQAKYVSNFEPTSNTDLRYSPAPVTPSVSPGGDTSSAAFKRWFKNSPFKNKDGTPKVYYHGAKKGGGFTVFRDWQYFTDKKQYAERYAERGNPNALYEVYLTADKVFDTRNADARKIFQSVRDEYGLSELQDTGLPDWTDGYDITEYLSEHPELGYDAVILDEGGDLVDGEPVSRGESIIIKDSAQVKSATDNIGTYDRANPDIRYSPVSPETDSRYLSLARDPQKNESELRRLVKEAAEKAGFNSPLLYHGTDYYGKITVFRKGKTGYLGGGIYFTDSETNAKRYAERMGAGTVYSAYLQVKNPLRVSSADPAKEILFAAYGSDRAYNARVQGQGNAAYLVQPKDIKKLQSLGYDGIVWKLAKGTETEYSVFEPSQIKSADPVTYDDSGNIIPLSDRFNPQNDDIRYSPASYGGKSGRYVAQSQPARQTIREKITNKAGQLNRQGFRNALKEGGSVVEGFKIGFVNAQQAVENQLVRAGMTKREAAAVIQYARTGRSHAFNAAQYKLADMTGEIRSDGLLKIIEPFLATKGEVFDAVDPKTGETVPTVAKGGEMGGRKYIDFGDYYSMLHALDREAAGNNPYSDMTVADMKRIVAEYEKENPDFKAAAEKLSAFNSALLDIEVQAGIRSQENADNLRKKYPHYIPMYVQEDGEIGRAPVKGARNMEVRRDNKEATESNHRVNDAIKNYLNQVERRIRAAKFNLVLQEVYNSADDVNVVKAEDAKATARDLREREKAYLENPESENDPAEMFRKVQKGRQTVNEVSFYMDGKRVTMAVTDRIYTGLSDLAGIHSSVLDLGLVKFVAKINSTFKKLVTNWNPFFAVKNIARDLQDGMLQSKFGMGEFIAMYKKNAEMMMSGKYNKEWELFLANGCLEASILSDEFGTVAKSGKSGLEQAVGVAGQFQHIKNFNTLTEALPRFTEFCLTLKHGGTIQQAIYNAADVTVNFGRSGTLIRILNSTVSPFLNPAVQGLDRVIRLFTENGIKNNKALASLLLKAVLLAIVPMALGNAMYGNDDEYKDMKDSIKENNYLFKVGDTWLKLPRGRVVSTISGLFNRSYKQLTGQDTDWGDYGKNVLDQITPAQNVARTIWSPFADVANNRTWYGTKIESDALQNYAVNQRYDENTSRISVWIGQLTSHFGLSPKEVNYLIDQYTGVVGDILLPTTTPAGTKGVVSYNFTVDPNTSSNLSNRFYDLYNKTMYKSNDGDVEAYYLKKRLDETKSAVSELFKQIKTINASSELSNKEKVKQASAIRASINQLYKTALDDRRLYEQNIKDALAIENSYAVEKITAQSAKRYGLDSDAVGKYALTFGGDFVKQYDTEAQANDYKADASKKTVYAEANRLTYGAEYALREYNVNVYDKAKTLNELGISYDEYYNYYMTARYYSGKTKKDKILAYLNGSGLSKSQIALMMYYSGYSAYADEAKKAIKASSLPAERKKELLAGLNN